MRNLYLLKLTQQLLQKGAKADIKDRDGKSAATWAKENGSVEISQELIKRGEH